MEQRALSFSSCRRRRVRAAFSGGSISSNAGALLLHEVDRQLGSWLRTKPMFGKIAAFPRRIGVQSGVRYRFLAASAVSSWPNGAFFTTKGEPDEDSA